MLNMKQFLAWETAKLIIGMNHKPMLNIKQFLAWETAKLVIGTNHKLMLNMKQFLAWETAKLIASAISQWAQMEPSDGDFVEPLPSLKIRGKQATTVLHFQES